MTYSGKTTPYSDQKNWSNDYLTDPELVRLLGQFNVDVCCPNKMPWKTASRMITVEQDGLTSEWRGRAFMNPPYRNVLKWAAKFAGHGWGIALLNGRSTETRATQMVMAASRAIWFPAKRLTFFKTSGKPWEQKWFPSLLIGMTETDYDKMTHAAKIYGGTVYARSKK